MVTKVTLKVGENEYIYPDGPTLPDYFVIEEEDSITFHLGRLEDLTGYKSTANPYYLTDHTVTIEIDGVVVHTEELKYHWWQGQWAYRKKPITIVNNPPTLVSKRLMFPYGRGNVPNIGSVPLVPYEVMGSSNITKYMPTTGERPDIGLITDNSAFFMLSWKPEPMLAWAQSGTTCPVHFRDETTGKPIDVFQYPGANCYDLPHYQGNPWLLKGPYADPTHVDGYTMFGAAPPLDWGPQKAHFCEMSYVAAVATNDLVFLRDLQHEANFLCIDTTQYSGKAFDGEYRGMAWGLRTIAMAWRATKEAEARGPLPASLHPSSYFYNILENARIFKFEPVRANPDNVFNMLVNGNTNFAPWQHDYFLTTLAFMNLIGLTEWKDLYLYAFKNIVDRTSGTTSDYPVGYGGGYYFNIMKMRRNDPGGWWEIDTDAEGKPQRYTTWKEMLLDLLSRNDGINQEVWDALQVDPYYGGRCFNGYEYLMTTRAALVMAQYLTKIGVVDVRSVYPELDTCVFNVERMLNYGGTTGGSLNPRQTVVVDPPTEPLELDIYYPPTPSGDGDGNPSTPPTPISFDPVSAPPVGFTPAEPTPDDVVAGDELEIYDTTHIRFNVIGNGKTIVKYWQYADRIHGESGGAYTVTPDGGFRFVETHASGQTITLYGVAGLLAGYGTQDAKLYENDPPTQWDQTEEPTDPTDPEEPPVDPEDPTDPTDPTEEPEEPNMSDQEKVDAVLAKVAAIDTKGDELVSFVQKIVALWTALKNAPAPEPTNTIPDGYMLIKITDFDTISAHVDGIAGDVDTAEEALPEDAKTPSN